MRVDAPDFAQRLAAFGSARFTALRPGQRQVLAAYAEHHLDASDVAIEMPTGEGKTLLALLIADLALERGWSVAYLTGTRQLAERVEEEAAALGLDLVRFAGGRYNAADLDDYHQAQAAAVMNYWVYFNAKPVPQPADLLLFDDAHLAEQPLSGLRTVRIPNRPGAARKLYRAICELVLAQSDAYSGLRGMLDGIARFDVPPELLSFTDWAAIVHPVRDAVEKSPFASDDEIKYVWPEVRDQLGRCGVLIGPSGIEIRPYHPPTTLNAGYRHAKQRIYLSATLGSMDDLQRRIGSGPVTRLTTADPLPSGTTGDRMLLLNPGDDQPLEPAVLGWALDQVDAAGGRAAWLCASHSEADLLQTALTDEGHTVYRLRPGDDAMVDNWSQAPAGHLVTAGRYDGLDLAGDVCRLVIITSVPQASSEFERFVVAYLNDAGYMRHRVGQRITQALGRANRDATDRSLYLGLDPRFAQILADPAIREFIPTGIHAAIRAALITHGEGWDATLRACDAFWTPGTSPSAATPANRRRPRPGRSTKGISDDASADHEVTASTDLWLGDHTAAATHARAAAAHLTAADETEHAAFWRYIEAHAHYDRGRPKDLVAARAALREATVSGPRTIWLLRLHRTIDDLDGIPRTADDTDRFFLVWDEWRREAGGRLDRVLSQGRAHLAGTHDQQCEGLVTLARLAGTSGERAPKQEQSATDCRWTWSTPTRAERRVWEVKTTPHGEPKPLSRADVNQLLGQIEVDTRRAGRTRVYGCLLTPATSTQPDAADAAHDKAVLINHGAAVRLYDLLAQRLRHYDQLCADDTADARGDARTRLEQQLPADGWLATLLSPSRGKMITAQDVEETFPRT
ncbi:DEAD/DEAH box helicase family protein [Frankia sp. Ag45/Mut15]|uniref:DEAD/DEAH box helicase family protein n=1 Tax=Frankia umida TaxID=573489 RepID=A0ABT0JZK0_9ACTN|nr:DEAD/DEAH box helicase family protein [Frankia umida]MCK9876968.1 DEAD/DEAH box helicase family protein [Frankia umida]